MPYQSPLCAHLAPVVQPPLGNAYTVEHFSISMEENRSFIHIAFVAVFRKHKKPFPEGQPGRGVMSEIPDIQSL